ncbi:MAG: SPOR domain-containing protein [Clostridia bacterium]|nr:SPOR domain-containing protein [Clostridia bacterium]
MTDFNENTLICGVKAGKIAGVVDAEGSVFARECYDALLAIVQTMHDMTASGIFGKDLEQVLRYHFCKGNERYHPLCLQAVYDVFIDGKRRNKDWLIYQFRSYAKYGTDDCLPDMEKLAPLLEKYEYLGKDGISRRWGHFYFGKKIGYQVQLGAYKVLANAQRLHDRVKGQGFAVTITGDKEGWYRVRSGNFFDRKNAEAHRAALVKKGYRNAYVVSSF